MTSISGNLPEKHTPLSVNCNGTLLPLVESARYIGVKFDSNMSWDGHVTRCANRESQKNMSPVEDAALPQHTGSDHLLPTHHNSRSSVGIKCTLDISGSQALSSTPGSGNPWYPCSVWTPAMDICT